MMPTMYSITFEQLEKLLDRALNGNPPSSGWGVYEISCLMCSTELVVVAMIGTTGMHCPKCGYEDTDYAWLDNQELHIGGDLNYLNPVAFTEAKFITRN